MLCRHHFDHFDATTIHNNEFKQVRIWKRFLLSGKQLPSEIRTGEAVTPALAPTSNIAVHDATGRRLHQLEGPCDSLGSPSTRATRPTASARVRIHAHRFSTIREVSQQKQLGRNPTFTMLPVEDRDTRKGSRIVNLRLASLCPISFGRLSTPLEACKPRSTSGDNASATSMKATKPLPCGGKPCVRPTGS